MQSAKLHSKSARRFSSVAGSMITSLGLRSPISRSGAVSPQPPRLAFDTEALRAYVKKLLPTTLSHAVWSSIERDQVKAWMKEIGERVKERMVEIQPNGLYVEQLMTYIKPIYMRLCLIC